jgi:hypothetical protein
MNFRSLAVVGIVLACTAVANAAATPEACTAAVHLGQAAGSEQPAEDRVAEYLELHARATGELPLDAWSALSARGH